MGKKKNEIIVGEFVITRDSGTPFDFMKITSKSGNWSMRIRQDQSVFEVIRELAKDESTHGYFETWIQIIYLMCTTVPDLEFIGEFAESYTALTKRQEKHALSDEEDAKILEEERRKYEFTNGTDDQQASSGQEEDGE